MSDQITPVTDQLKNALAVTSRSLPALDQRTTSKRLKDAEDFESVASSLELLTVAVLGAVSGTSLLGGNTKPGARFDLASGTDLANHLTDCVAYLRDAASNLIGSQNLNRYEGPNSLNAIRMLKTLYQLVLAGIRFQARADLANLSASSPNALIEAAERLAITASKDTWSAA